MEVIPKIEILKSRILEESLREVNQTYEIELLKQRQSHLKNE